MFCSKCGYELKNEEDFCPKCGAKVKDKSKEKNSEKKVIENDKTINQSGKKRSVVSIIIIVVLLIILVLFIINFTLFKRSMRNSGHFEKIDGVDTYIENGEIVTNSLVRIRGKKIYFVDEKGHKKKNTWEVIDNDGTYGYFGSLGELVQNKIREIDGKKYYFDVDGKLATNKEIEVNGIKYNADINGELTPLNGYNKVESKVSETVIAKITPTTKEIDVTTQVSTTQKIETQTSQAIIKEATLQSTTPATNQIVQTTVQSVAPSYIIIDTTKATEVAEATIVVNENLGPGVGIVDTYKKSYAVDDPANLNTKEIENKKVEDNADGTEYTVKIKTTEKNVDSVDNDSYSYECLVTLVKPIMQGKNSEETENLNDTIDELMDILWDEVESLVNDYSTLPQSVTFSTPNLGTVNNEKIQIFLPGIIKTSSGSTKQIKYRITYNREDGNGDIAKVS